ncbi:MAG: peptidase M10 [Candidatus Dadabacteria bacterium]
MGEAEVKELGREIIIYSHIITYGSAADEVVTERMRNEIESMWNEPAAIVYLHGEEHRVRFAISAELKVHVDELEVLQNTDPRNNYFRIENYAEGNISYVDGLGCNTGYFLLENLYEGSTTAAHEYGHTLGLDHPKDIDFRGKGVPGIMYPRGTLVDPQYQYDPSKPAGVTGGTMKPTFRKVRVEDVEQLFKRKHQFEGNKAIIGEFTNVYHWSHLDK